MKRFSNYIYLAAYLSILIPTPGRFVFGFTIMLELFLFTVIGQLINSLITKLKYKELRTALLFLFLVSLTILYRQILIIFQTEVALDLGILFYFPPFSIFFANILLRDTQQPLEKRLKMNLKHISIFCSSGLIFFLLRDVIAYGTFTFYGKNHQIFEKILFKPASSGFFSFFASIPGALIAGGLLLLGLKLCQHKINIIKNLEAQNDLH